MGFNYDLLSTPPQEGRFIMIKEVKGEAISFNMKKGSKGEYLMRILDGGWVEVLPPSPKSVIGYFYKLKVH